MISPVEVRNQEFSRGFRGYSEKEVDSFVAQISDDFEKLYHENAQLKENLKRQEAELEKYRKLEDTLNQALILAQQTAEDIKTNASNEARLLLEKSRVKVSEIFLAYEDVLKKLHTYRSEIKSYIHSQAELVEQYDKRLEELSSFLAAEDIKEVLAGLEKSGLGDAK
jgi:cell division initiation protein